MTLCIEYHWYCDDCHMELTSIHMHADLRKSLRALRLEGWQAETGHGILVNGEVHTVYRVTCPECVKKATQRTFRARKETA